MNPLTNDDEFRAQDLSINVQTCYKCTGLTLSLSLLSLPRFDPYTVLGSSTWILMLNKPLNKAHVQDRQAQRCIRKGLFDSAVKLEKSIIKNFEVRSKLIISLRSPRGFKPQADRYYIYSSYSDHYVTRPIIYLCPCKPELIFKKRV